MTINSNTTFETSVIALVARQTEDRVDTLTRDDRLTDLDFDSLDVIEFVHVLKEDLDITVNPFALSEAATVGDIVDTVVGARE